MEKRLTNKDKEDIKKLKTLKVSDGIWKKIQQIKLDYGLNSVEEVIIMLIKRGSLKG